MTYRPVRKAAVLALAALVGAVIALTDSGGSASASAAIRRATTTSPDCGAAVRKSYFKTWTCTFADNFDGSALDPTKWQAITTASNGYAGGEACYVDSPNNISVAGGYLTLTARQEAAPFTCQSPKGNFTTQYTTGQVATYGKFFQTYGRFAVRAKFPAATISGLQSTLWLWPESPLTTGAVGEIDFAEWYSYQADKITPFLHYIYDPSTTNYTTGVNVATKTCPVIDASAFHEYAVEWSSSTIKIYIDGQTCLTDKYVPYGTNPFNQPYFIALSQALGLSPNNFYPGITPLPATTTIDWVRAWK